MGFFWTPGSMCVCQVDSSRSYCCLRLSNFFCSPLRRRSLNSRIGLPDLLRELVKEI